MLFKLNEQMELTLEESRTGEVVEVRDFGQVEDAIDALGEDEDAFMILAIDDMNYMQSTLAGESDENEEGYVAEVQYELPEGGFRHCRTWVASGDELKRLFAKYCERRLDLSSWEDMTRECWPCCEQ